VALGYFRIIDVQIGSLDIDAKGGITGVPEIANRDGKSVRVGASGGLENGFFRTAPSATDAAKLQDANGKKGTFISLGTKAGCTLLLRDCRRAGLAKR
jgi:hypothetical protein